MPLTAIILAAGEGTRMKSRHPKVMHKLLDKPLVGWVVDAARRAGSDRIIVVVGHGAAEVKAYLGNDDVEFVEQTQQLGTGHAVRCVFDALYATTAEKTDEVATTTGVAVVGASTAATTDPAARAADEHIVVLYGDTPLVRPETIRTLVQTTTEQHYACSVLTMLPPDPAGYGRIAYKDEQLHVIIEDKDCSDEQRQTLRECNSGLYCFKASELAQGIQQLSCNNAQHEYYLTDMVGYLVNKHERLQSVCCDDYKELLGVNSRTQLAQAAKIMQTRINEYHMSRGVSMLDPSTVWIGADVKIGQDTEILPNSILFGDTRVGSECTIGPNTRLINSQVGDECLVDESVVVDSRIDNKVSCGPRAYLRGHTHLKDRAKAGTHVELKNSTVGEGSKVPHLSYIGDTTMGSGVNIGGGSITCNYDGVHKHKTIIGDNAFIGSDTMMVAPVNIGAGAMTGASSCIYKDVPADALAIERSEEVIKEGFAKTKRAKLEKGH